MSNGLSEYVRFFLANYQEVWAAEDRFWREWRGIQDRVVEALARETAGTQWSCVREGELLKLYKATWPAPQTNSVHFEIDPRHDDAWKHGHFWIALDVEGEALPNRGEVASKLRELLRRYKPWIEQGTPCRVRDLDDWRVVGSQRGMDEAYVEAMAMAIRALLPLGVLVDESLALSSVHTIWRSDFRQSDPLPMLERERDPGGQLIDPATGLFGSPALVIDGRKTNSTGWNPPRNRALLCKTTELAAGDEFYASVVLRVSSPAKLSVPGYGYGQIEGKSTQSADCLCASAELDGGREWQHVRVEGRVVAQNGYDPTKEPLHVYLFVLTEDTSLAINSIEFGKLHP